MLILGVIIEYAATSLDRPFSYAYNGNKIIKEGIRVYVEFAHRKVVGYVVSVAPSSLNLEEYQQETGIKVKEIESIIDEEPLFNEELSLLSKKIASYYFAPLISVYQSMLPPSLKPKSSSLSKPKIAYESFYVPLSSCEEGLSAKQKELLRLINKEKEIAKKDISSLSVLKKLEEKNLVKEIKKEKIRLIQEDVPLEEYKELNDEQEKAFKEIVFGNDRSFLLEGVTGSGKTEVYLHASRELIKQGKSVLMLVPEISLTVQMVRRFKARFKKIAILHS
ncbi:MAG: DEAD/DEAH box helicase family protein [Bacillales bacterium]|nr:DEAD/DEAH box helicase family protein [Bacillales bacterium]